MGDLEFDVFQARIRAQSLQDDLDGDSIRSLHKRLRKHPPRKTNSSQNRGKVVG